MVMEFLFAGAVGGAITGKLIQMEARASSKEHEIIGIIRACSRLSREWLL